MDKGIGTPPPPPTHLVHIDIHAHPRQGKCTLPEGLGHTVVVRATTSPPELSHLRRLPHACPEDGVFFSIMSSHGVSKMLPHHLPPPLPPPPPPPHTHGHGCP